MTDKTVLPPLPKPAYAFGTKGMLGENCYTADQMREYAERAVLASAGEQAKDAGLQEAVSIIKGIDDGEAPEYMACIEAINAAIASGKSGEVNNA